MVAQNAINNTQFSSINIVTFTSNGTYTPPANLIYADVVCVGAGGGAAGCEAAGLNETSGGGGGASGSLTRKVYPRSALAPSVAVTVGVGGAGGASGVNNGSAGTDTTFLGMTAAGGGGGISVASGVSVNALGGFAVVPTGGDINIKGSDGVQFAACYLSVIIRQYEPLSTASPLSGVSWSAEGNSPAANAYGGGAGPTASWNPGTVTSELAKAGAPGADGVVIITEYLAS